MNTRVLARAYSSTSGTHLLPDLFVLRGVGRLLPSASSASTTGSTSTTSSTSRTSNAGDY